MIHFQWQSFLKMDISHFVRSRFQGGTGSEPPGPAAAACRTELLLPAGALSLSCSLLQGYCTRPLGTRPPSLPLCLPGSPFSLYPLLGHSLPLSPSVFSLLLLSLFISLHPTFVPMSSPPPLSQCISPFIGSVAELRPLVSQQAHHTFPV